jgi:hypothetical protein
MTAEIPIDFDLAWLWCAFAAAFCFCFCLVRFAIAREFDSCLLLGVGSMTSSFAFSVVFVSRSLLWQHGSLV